MLKSLSRKKKIVLLIILFLLFAVVIINKVEVYVASIFIILFLIANHFIYKKLAYNAIHLFSTIDRNYEYLVIGDWCDIENIVKGSKFISFLSPEKRSPYIILELIKRLYSLLDEKKGTIVIVLNKKHSNKKRFSVFDIPFLHEITLKNKGIGWMKYAVRLPLLFNPYRCLLLFRNKRVDFEEVECPFPEISKFCNDRGVRLIFNYIK